MKLKSRMKSAFIPTLSSITLSIITTTGVSSSVLALPGKVGLHSADQLNSKKQVIAQFQGTEQEERSQLLQQANTLSSQGKFADAEENLRKLIKKFPKYSFGHFELGNVLFRQDKAEEAISAYREAIRLNSNHALAYNGIGLVYASQNRWEEAITEYQKALEINPNYGDALANSALALLQTNKRNEALASLEKALNIFKSQSRNEKVYQIEQLLQQIKASDDPAIS
ncbi:tetratricopeptide repeat protein [Nostocales cyanobacterium LEGE 11386]|nr:tetratricopeptide repeat protein [Nostocales cyanobacterium LEGE 11386]